MAALKLWIPVDDVELGSFLLLRSCSGAVVSRRWGVEGMGGPRLGIKSHDSALITVLVACWVEQGATGYLPRIDSVQCAGPLGTLTSRQCLR